MQKTDSFPKVIFYEIGCGLINRQNILKRKTEIQRQKGLSRKNLVIN